MGRERLETEFGPYSDWIVEACLALDVDLIPAAARGTGRPALLEYVASFLGAGRGSLILDLGCGLGAPGAWLAGRTGCEVVGVDVMQANVRGLRRLFPEIEGAVASMRSLPIRDGVFDGAWALGALEMVSDKATAALEAYRVLRPGGTFVVYDYVLTERPAGPVPDADRFARPSDTSGCLEDAGFALRKAEPLGALDPTPERWKTSRAAVRDRVRAEHGDDRRWQVVQDELDGFRRLVQQGAIVEWLFVADKEGP